MEFALHFQPLWVVGEGISRWWFLKMNQTTLTEKRFFEWHEDDISVTIRNKGGSYGGGQKC